MSSPDLTGWLLTYLVHSTLLLLAATIMAPRFRSHRVRETLWKTALFGGFFTATGQTVLRDGPFRNTVAAPMTLAVAPVVQAPVQQIVEPKSEKSEKKKSSLGAITAPAPSVSRINQGDLLLLAWGLGAVVLLTLYVVRRARFARRIRHRQELTTEPLALMLAELRAEVEMTRPVRLTAAGSLPSPVALGRDEIAVPEAALTELDEGQQRSMLAHELAHIDRRDPAWLTAACLAESIAFIQPLNRLARLRMQESAEYLCDEWAVSRTGSGVLLAKCLAKVAEWLEANPRTLPLAGMAEDRSHLVARVRRLLDGSPFPKGPGRRTLVTASVGVIALTLLTLPGVSLSRGNASPAQTPSASSLTLPPATPADTNRAIVVALMGVLKDPNVEVRRAAVKSLSNFEDKAAAVALREATRDSDAEVRANAVEALGDMHDVESLDAIVALLRDPNKDVRSHAVESLTDLELTSPPNGLLEALKDPDAEVRHEAAHAVGHFEDARAVPQLRLMLDDVNGDVRTAAVEALGEIRGEAAIQALIVALKAKDPKVRQAAADALGNK